VRRVYQARRLATVSSNHLPIPWLSLMSITTYPQWVDKAACKAISTRVGEFSR
jgi:hypothetical protein